jgi:glycosyltransferase involved in cell wall biosynthesis
MKVLFLTNIPSPYRVEFFNELGKQCELTVLYELKQAKDRDSKWNTYEAKHFTEKYFKGIKMGHDFVLCFSVLKYLNDKSYDIIVIGGYSTPTGILSIEYLKYKKIPFIINSDGGMIKNDSGIGYRIKKHLISSASAWLSTGEITTKYLLHYGAQQERIYVYPFTSLKKQDILTNILSKEEKMEVKREINIQEKKVVVSVGQFIYRKGFDVLIKACNYLDKDIGLYIIGGEPTKEYKDLKEKLSLNNVHFVGFKTKDELNKYYKAADLFVLPTREDIWGLVINEAMAFGLPIVTTDKCVAGLELIKDYENGFIVPVDAEKQLADKINFIISDNNLCESMSQKNLNKIREYTIENMANRHMEIFENIIGVKYQ